MTFPLIKSHVELGLTPLFLIPQISLLIPRRPFALPMKYPDSVKYLEAFKLTSWKPLVKSEVFFKTQVRHSVSARKVNAKSVSCSCTLQSAFQCVLRCSSLLLLPLGCSLCLYHSPEAFGCFIGEIVWGVPYKSCWCRPAWFLCHCAP